MKRAIFLGAAMLCTVSLTACGRADEITHMQETEESISVEQQPDTSIQEEIKTPTSAPAEAEEEASVPSEQEETTSGRIQWQVYIQSDIPEPYIEILKQYEQFVNADVQNLNDEDVQKKFNWIDGEWRYLLNEWCGSWMSAVYFQGEDVVEDLFYYSLEDLTNDGFPELIMGYYNSDYSDPASLYGVYYYSETEGIKMEYTSRYYTMNLYEGGIIGYESAGATYTITYYEYQDETENWELAARVIVDWDPRSDSVTGYYWGDNVADLHDNEPMSEQEYWEIIKKYATEPVELEWIPLVFSVEPTDGIELERGGNLSY